MTDTRKDFEDWFLSQYGVHYKYAEIQFDHAPETKIAWQACQSLNDKRIQQLLAVIAKKDEAINAMLKVAYSLPPTTEAEHAIRNKEVHDATEGLKQAIAIKPQDVELVEVGEADFDKPAGTVNLDIYNIDFDGLHNLYTIKTKE